MYIFHLFPNQACLWASYSSERISVRVPREGGSPTMQKRFPQRSWYQDLVTKMMVPTVNLDVNLIVNLVAHLVVNLVMNLVVNAFSSKQETLCHLSEGTAQA